MTEIQTHTGLQDLKKNYVKLNSKRYHQYQYEPEGLKVSTGMMACLNNMQGDRGSTCDNLSSTGDMLKALDGAIMIMLFLLNPVLGQIKANPSHKRYCAGQLATLKTAFDLANV